MSHVEGSGTNGIALPSRFMLLFASLVTALISVNVQAGSFEATTEQVKVQLIASADAVHPGDVILLGIHQRIIPHWHTYWKNPGDSGLATTIDYEVPDGATVGEIQWPTPSRISLGPVTNYGYENEVTLLTAIKVPKDTVIGGVFPVKAKVKWLVCEEICIPQQAELSLDLPVVMLEQNINTRHPLIEQALIRLPVPNPWPISVLPSDEHLILQINGSGLQPGAIKDIWFYPAEWGGVSHGAEQPFSFAGDAIELRLKPGDLKLGENDHLKGVLTITEENSEGLVTRGYTIDVTLLPGALKAKLPVAHTPDIVLSTALLLAFLGGVILNLMPCVFPVLSIKALSLIKQANEDPLTTRLHGLAYTLGILVSFALLGGVLIILKLSGSQIGWGFQFQSPLFVLAMAYLMFAVGLNLSGLFSIGGSVAGIGNSLSERPGYTGSFFTGVLATLVATPCTAPFMGAALGFAISQPPALLMFVLLSLGLGLALPYLLLCVWPSLQKLLPKPGAWMVRLKQGLAFPMYGAAVWLVWVLTQQIGPDAVIIGLGGMIALAIAAWAYESTKYGSKSTRFTGTTIAIVFLLISVSGSYLGIKNKPVPSSSASLADTNERNWEPYSSERLAQLLTSEKPVFINFTAAWCISCLVNEKVALSQTSVLDTFKRIGITYLKGDWTNRDPGITQMLSEFGRSGVPLYIFYPGGSSTKPVVLPQILTPDIVIRAVSDFSSLTD
ncbi:thioredoxin family protein [Methylicorpusculum oleiharenae]|uniref:protein-disulfide reductase DsbD family protein n=1 Tax=Methylicorpusculum oleiharenae TaxID=1338687 RepID=UPI001E5A6741|nr:protein-disulfide reductase DsbD domain-containing protein [Methylicorpusculum oleiharenae]MCD2450500.1 thioredoxin family protein [Methylicorpusculum oleiharenae]